MQTYSVELTERFQKAFKKLDKYTQRILRAWIDKNLVNTLNPRSYGNGLTANLSGKWRYRVGEYRLICQIYDDKLLILALNVGHRRDEYSSNK